jgi:hypothetical protein
MSLSTLAGSSHSRVLSGGRLRMLRHGCLSCSPCLTAWLQLGWWSFGWFDLFSLLREHSCLNRTHVPAWVLSPA